MYYSEVVRQDWYIGCNSLSRTFTATQTLTSSYLSSRDYAFLQDGALNVLSGDESGWLRILLRNLGVFYLWVSLGIPCDAQCPKYKWRKKQSFAPHIKDVYNRNRTIPTFSVRFGTWTLEYMKAHCYRCAVVCYNKAGRHQQDYVKYHWILRKVWTIKEEVTLRKEMEIHRKRIIPQLRHERKHDNTVMKIVLDQRSRFIWISTKAADRLVQCQKFMQGTLTQWCNYDKDGAI